MFNFNNIYRVFSKQIDCVQYFKADMYIDILVRLAIQGCKLCYKRKNGFVTFGQNNKLLLSYFYTTKIGCS